MRNVAVRAPWACGALSLIALVACSSKSNSGGGDGGPGPTGGLTTGGFTTGIGVGSSTTGNSSGTGTTSGTSTTSGGPTTSTTSTTSGMPATSTTTGGSTTGGAGGSSGTSDDCAKACARLDALKCPQDQPGNCARTVCALAICHSEVEALAVCVLRATLVCDADGQANTNDCDPEAQALDDCVAAGGP